MTAVCVYCASSDGIAERHLALAAEVGRQVAARGWTLVSGGGSKSMMGAVAAAARAGGAHTTGVIPRSMVEREWADHASDELLVVDSMRERKAQMEARADAFLALPGGLGTCEELFEIWTSGYLRLHAKPVVLLDPDGHWAGLLAWVRDLAAQGFVGADALRRLVVTTDVAAALDACVAPVPGDGRTPEQATWVDPRDGQTAEPAGWVDPGDGQTAEPAEQARWVDPGDGGLRSVRSRRGG